MIERRQQLNLEVHPGILCRLACVYVRQGHYEEAERLFVENLPSDKIGPSFSEGQGWKYYINWLAELYLYQGRYEEAEPLFKSTIEAQGGEGSGYPWDAVHSMYGLGCIYMAQGRYGQAEGQFIKGIETGQRRLAGKDHPLTLLNKNGLAVLRTKQKQYEDAEHLFREALEGRKLKLGDDHPDTLETKNDLAVLYKEQARYEEAEPLLVEAIEGRRLKLGDTHPHTIESCNNLINLYESWNKPEKAEQWRAKNKSFVIENR
jgi:tetratricopeptide (TPR) repeat protein